MAYAFYKIRVKDDGRAAVELNEFLASHRILSVRTDDCAHDDPCREISVNYREGTSTSRPRRPGS